MPSAFDVDAFVNSTTEAPLPTRMLPIPVGEFLAVVSSHDKWCEVRAITEGKMAGRVIADIHFDILDDNVKAQMGMDTVRIRESYFLDLTPDGRVDFSPNKNVKLGRLRDACGQNKPGIPFGNLKGAGPVRISVIQEPDEKDASIIYNRVKAVTSLAPGAKAA